MKLLPGPYGWNAYTAYHISLQGTCTDEQALVNILQSYSCYSPAIPKILSCLRYSERYDCIVQFGWFHNQRVEVAKKLAHIGITLHILRRWP